MSQARATFHTLSPPQLMQAHRTMFTSTIHSLHWQPDFAQAQAVTRLQHLLTALQSNLAKPPKGLWLFGPPGRGKSQLLNVFMQHLPTSMRSRRVHFHSFMAEIHHRFHTLQCPAGKDPMAIVASDIAQTAQVLGFDEFYLTNIADAMLLGRLMQALFRQGVVVVATSNWDMPNLFQGGLNRDRFLPFLKLMESHLEPIDLRQGPDWRLQGQPSAIHVGQYILTPAGESPQAHLQTLFHEFSTGPEQPPCTTFSVKQQRGQAIWLTFSQACDHPHSRSDYAELANHFSTIILEGIPQLTAREADPTLRLTMLVDILYEHNRRLVVSAAVPPLHIALQGDAAQVFQRTASRLVQMTGYQAS
jgi:cell division protein ZapE